MSKITLVEQASDPATPAAGQVVVYAKQDDLMYWKDDGGVTHRVAEGPAVAAGTQTGSSGTVVFSNSNGLTFGLSGSLTVTASIDAVRAVSAGTSSGIVSHLVFSNSNGISFGLSGATITAQIPTVSYAEIGRGDQLLGVTASSASSNLTLMRAVLPFQVSATRLDFLGHLTVVGSTNGSYTASAAVYTMTGSTLNLASSSSVGVTFTSGTNSTTVSVYGAHSGTRWRSVPTGTWNLTPGEYVFGLMLSQAGVAGTTGSWSLACQESISVIQEVGVSAAQNDYFADGVFSAATGAFPSSIGLASGVIQSGGAPFRNFPSFRLIGTF
jgi:hypothetical protein